MTLIEFVLILEDLIPVPWVIVEASGPVPYMEVQGMWTAIVATCRGDEELNFTFEARKRAEDRILKDEMMTVVANHEREWRKRGEG